MTKVFFVGDFSSLCVSQKNSVVGREREWLWRIFERTYCHTCVGPEWGLRGLWRVGHTAFLNCFPRFAPPTPSPQHMSPGRIPAPPSLLQRAHPPHTQQPPGSLLKSYHPETNPAFQSNGIHVHGKLGLAALWVLKDSVLLLPLIKCPRDLLWVSDVLFYIRLGLLDYPYTHTHIHTY